MTITLKKLMATTGACFALSACANLSAVQYRYEHEKSQTVLIDAKQRAINVYSGNGKDKGDQMCSEQSPDAFSVFAASAGASGNASSPTGESVGAALALAQAESGASLAFRTQLTQSTSQLLYQLCALKANGAISELEVATQLRRFQRSLVALLAVEQLTGVARPPTVVIGTNAAATTGDKLAEAQEQLNEAKAAAAEADKAVAAAQKVADASAATVAADAETATKDTDDVKSKQDQYNTDKAAAEAAPTNTALAATADESKGKLEKAIETQAANKKLLDANKAKQATDAADLKTKKAAAADAAANVAAFTSNRDILRGALSAGATSAPAAFNTPTLPAAMSDAAAASISKAVRDIVSISADNGYTDACLVLLTKVDKDSAALATALNCQAHLTNADAYRLKYLDVYLQKANGDMPAPSGIMKDNQKK